MVKIYFSACMSKGTAPPLNPKLTSWCMAVAPRAIIELGKIFLVNKIYLQVKAKRLNM